MEWVVEEGGYKYNYKQVTSYRNREYFSYFSAILNFCAPHNSYVATIIPNVLDFGGFFLTFIFFI